MNNNMSTQKSRKGFSIVFAVVIGVVVLTGVIGVMMAVNNNKLKTPTGTNSATEKNAYGTPTGGSGTKSSANVPKNLPQYPGAQIKNAETAAEGSSLEMELAIGGVDANVLVDTIRAYYKQELPKMGWKIGVREGDSPEHDGPLDFYNDQYDGILAVIILQDTISISLITIIPNVLR